MSDSNQTFAVPPAPVTFAEAMDPAWLTHALSSLTSGARITDVEVVEVIRTMATKVRFTAAWEGGTAALCLKAFLDVDAATSKGGAVTITEADFYSHLAPRLGVRVPACIAMITDRPRAQGIIIMRDLIAEGARFCTALDPFSVDEAAASLEQIAILHAGSAELQRATWVGRRIADFADRNFVPAVVLQQLLDGPRGEGLDSKARDANRLIAGLKELARVDGSQPQTLIHGDCHAGNIFQTRDGPGLIDWQLVQRGGWALDVAYHICAVLPVETAAAHEWTLLDHYLDKARRLGVDLPSPEAARERYRAAVVYGYYLWAITRRVDPPIINIFVNRLGNAVMRHESYRVLGL